MDLRGQRWTSGSGSGQKDVAQHLMAPSAHPDPWPSRALPHSGAERGPNTAELPPREGLRHADCKQLLVSWRAK